VFDLIKKIEKKCRIVKPRLERKVKISKNSLVFYRNFFKKYNFYKQFPDQIVQSIYFDDYNLSFAKSNIDGEFYRIKPRIRWYNNDLLKIKYEFKIKKGFNGYKVISNDIYDNENDINIILKKTKNFFKEIFDKNLNEIITIRYNRSYLKHPSGIRLTLDKNLTYELSRSHNKKSLDFDVFEFKYNVDKDYYFRKVLFNNFSDLPFRLSKCSKYVEAITTEYS
tara:strand:+ start:1351 stop:2019 length:669 start_codon:yes stop_codon:yes gene_type:complete